jgi:hypothetical protein
VTSIRDNHPKRTSFEDTDLYLPTIKEILASAKMDSNRSSNATDIYEWAPIDTNTSLPGSNITDFGLIQFGTNASKYPDHFDSN